MGSPQGAAHSKQQSFCFPLTVGGPAAQENTSKEPPHDLDFKLFRAVNSHIKCETYEALKDILEEINPVSVNFMNDSLLHVVIACKKSRLALKLIENISTNVVSKLIEHKNYFGDTPLHIAAAVDEVEVALALIGKKTDLVHQRNQKEETPLHMAALNGHASMFWCLVKNHSKPCARKENGATVLHCAIMGNNLVLALDIAKTYPDLILWRTDLAVTPLQLMVTIPDLFRSQLVLGPFDTFLYEWIPLEDDSDHKISRVDEEAPAGTPLSSHLEVTSKDRIRSKFPSQYSTLFDLLELVNIPARWIQLCLFKIIKQCFLPIQHLESSKKKHKAAMDLIGHLANKKEYFDFYCKGYSGGPDRSTSFPSTPGFVGNDDSHQHDSKSQLLDQFADKLLKYLSFNNDEPKISTKDLINNMQKALEEISSNSDIRWHESPLITGAKLGLDDFVCKILRVCPHSATYLDFDGRNVLQAAIKYGCKEIVKVIGKMTQGNNPPLPSWLYSCVDVKTGNTILHFASEKAETAEDALQLHDELKWFEIVRKILPRELWNIRNLKDKTAQELFTEKHEKMLNTCKTQLIEMGKTCSALVAAVVFASSFSIPGEKDPSTGNPLYFNRMPFKIFSHAYVIGFACATTSLVLFLSLIITPYKEHDFLWTIPLKYFFACLSFAMALVAFLISSTCNIFLQIYGGQRTETKDLIPLLLELTVFPALCFLLLLYSGARFGPSFSRLFT